MLIIPAIDILGGKVVRLSKGDFNQSTFYDFSPLELAVKYFSAGFEWIHIVDLLGSKEGKIGIQNLLGEIKASVNIKIEFGGGIRNETQIEELISLGVDRIVVGSLSITNKKLFENVVSKFSPEKFIAAIDVMNEKVFIKGWTEDSHVGLYQHIEYCSLLGMKTFLCTDISKDGTLKGPNNDMYKNIMTRFPKINVIASGGISSIEDIKKLNEHNLYAAVVGKAIYENKINLEELVKIGC
ncbi:MAG: 1-(5-phosphoribosyl)-5-[(5-phosphoribosylamino)methylideneamino]imidazole-4-carboxamide isomerase [Ignavibacteriales bacterium]|nr:1-(5-phosphoribosyl)-5-[(5-phosphoribosylamino)methylideneamino]imidazole-4-carboxamide isomerase [Ignavibacteriales bacterium]